MTSESAKIVVLSGGVGAAKFLRALQMLDQKIEITAIVNTGDDTKHCGLHVSPDIDTIIYTLSNNINKKTGWGLKNETWNAMKGLNDLEVHLNAELNEGENTYGWFNLGDNDIGTHLYRTSRLLDGIPLSQITAEIAKKFDIDINILPMSNDSVQTKLSLTDSKTEISFQEYFVKHKHNIAIDSVRFEGAQSAIPAPSVIEAIESADKIIIAPSNPVLSISPILAIEKISQLISKRRKDCAFISPLVDGKALKGPADRIMLELGYIPDAGGVAKFYSDYADNAVIDTQDINLVPAIEEMGLKCLAVNTIMSNSKTSKQLAEFIMNFLFMPEI